MKTHTAKYLAAAEVSHRIGGGWMIGTRGAKDTIKTENTESIKQSLQRTKETEVIIMDPARV